MSKTIKCEVLSQFLQWELSVKLKQLTLNHSGEKKKWSYFIIRILDTLSCKLFLLLIALSGYKIKWAAMAGHPVF